MNTAYPSRQPRRRLLVGGDDDGYAFVRVSEIGQDDITSESFVLNPREKQQLIKALQNGEPIEFAY